MMEATSAWLSSTRPRRGEGAIRLLKSPFSLPIPSSRLYDGDDGTLSLEASLKLAYKNAKQSRSREALVEALTRADQVVENGLINDVKTGHILVSVYKLVDKGRGSYIKSALSTLSKMISVGTIPDTPMFNNIIDMCAKSNAPVDMI